jgi:glycosyltransferase involved in cell wall biosynthesis
MQKKICLIFHEPQISNTNLIHDINFYLLKLLRELSYEVYIGLIYENPYYPNEFQSKLNQFNNPDNFNINVFLIKIDPAYHVSYYRKLSFQTYQYLKNINFAAIIFFDYMGIAYYSLMAKKSGASFTDTEFFILCYSNIKHRKFLIKQFISERHELEQDFLENESLKLCENNLILFPQYTKYLGGKINHHENQNYDSEKLINEKISLKTNFFIEYHQNNIDFFINFYNKILDNHFNTLHINSLNKNLIDKLKEISNNNPKIKLYHENFINPFHHIENSPTNIYINFNDTNIKQKTILFDQSDILYFFLSEDSFETPSDFYDYISDELTGSINLIKERLYQNTYIINDILSNNKHSQAITKNNPTVSVCLIHYNRPKLLGYALQSLRNQTYKNFEVILVDDGSTTEESIKYLDSLNDEFTQKSWKIIRQKNQYLGAARNNAVKQASSEYIIFMDDDNYAMPFMIEKFINAAEFSNAQIITAPFKKFTNNGYVKSDDDISGYYIPLGNCISLGVMENCFGDANSLVRRDFFEKMGGFTEKYGIGHEDWEFFIKACLQGCEFLVIPEFLFYYRVDPNSMVRSTNQYLNFMRILDNFKDSDAPIHKFFPVLEFTIAGSFSDDTQSNNNIVKKFSFFYPIINLILPLHSKRRKFVKKLLNLFK